MINDSTFAFSTVTSSVIFYGFFGVTIFSEVEELLLEDLDLTGKGSGLGRSSGTQGRSFDTKGAGPVTIGTEHSVSGTTSGAFFYCTINMLIFSMGKGILGSFFL